MKFCLPLFLLSTLPLFSSQEVQVHLYHPTYEKGVLSTREGGVIEAEDLRIQGRHIEYLRQVMEGDKPLHQIRASGDLMIQYKGKVYVGDSLEYNLDEREGTLFNGKTLSTMWYVSGDKIELRPDGSYKASHVSITTCENKESTWDLHAKSVQAIKNDLFEAKNVRMRLFKVPTLWLPSFKMNLKKFKEPVFRYTVNWDKGQGPRAGVRYQLYSWRDFALYGRLEYRWKTGFGGAVETEYFPTDHKTTFVTRSYLGSDKLETAPDKMRRYRLQGALHSESASEKTKVTVTWDKYSDFRMPSDFKSEDFEVGSAKKTLFWIHHQEERLLTSFKVRPKVNPFESIQQDLPTFYATTLPLSLGRSGIVSTTSLKASYLDFSYSSQLSSPLPNYDAIRLELQEKLIRPCHLGPLIFTPYLGGVALFYSKSPVNKEQGVGLLSYGAKAFLQGRRTFSSWTHTLEPYLSYQALTRPTVLPDEHYIFSLQDGYQKIDQLSLGLRQLLSSPSSPLPFFTADLFANAFFFDPTIPPLFPKGYLSLTWRLPSLIIQWDNCWNFWNHLLDFSNARCRWTINEDIALSLEGRYRSSYDWRKADHENFILDVTRPEELLLSSPLSDRRATLLARLFWRLTPFWECQLEAHSGFYRKNERPYTELKLDLFTWISASWKLRLSYSHTDLDDRVTAGLMMVKH